MPIVLSLTVKSLTVLFYENIIKILVSNQPVANLALALALALYSLTLNTSFVLQFYYFCDGNWKKQDAHSEKYPILYQNLEHNSTLLFCDYHTEIIFLAE